MRTNELTGMGRTTFVTLLVRYHDTIIVDLHDNDCILRSNGWMFQKGKVTTKIKMNQAAAQFNLPYRVYSENKVMRIQLRNKKRNRAYEFDYYDDLEFDITDPQPPLQAKNVTVIDTLNDKIILATSSWESHLRNRNRQPSMAVGAK